MQRTLALLITRWAYGPLVVSHILPAETLSNDIRLSHSVVGGWVQVRAVGERLTQRHSSKRCSCALVKAAAR